MNSFYYDANKKAISPLTNKGLLADANVLASIAFLYPKGCLLGRVALIPICRIAGEEVLCAETSVHQIRFMDE